MPEAIVHRQMHDPPALLLFEDIPHGSEGAELPVRREEDGLLGLQREEAEDMEGQGEEVVEEGFDGGSPAFGANMVLHIDGCF